MSSRKFCGERSHRRKAFARDLRDLRESIKNFGAVGEMSTGNAKADELIKLWAPSALDVGGRGVEKTFARSTYHVRSPGPGLDLVVFG